MNHKKKEIIDAAQSLFIKKGFTSTSIQDILDAASISKGTFYNYFTSKNECLIAILSLIKEEITCERKRLAASKEKKDKSVFSKQIAVRFHVDKKHNLMALFSSLPTADAQDDELQAYMNKQYLEEISWIAERFISIYGQNISSQAYDYAVIFLGNVHFSSKILYDIAPTNVEVESIIQFCLRQVDDLMKSHTIDRPVLLQADYFYPYKSKPDGTVDEFKREMQEILCSLEERKDGQTEPKTSYFIHFLKEELDKKHPQFFLIESVIHSLVHAFESTSHEKDARYLFTLFTYIDKKQQKTLSHKPI